MARYLIAFAFVATHNHLLDRGGKVFSRSAPVIKLPAEASEDDHLALLGVLNSSTACFWLKQVCQDKGNRGGERSTGRYAWENYFEFTGTKLEQFPLPTDLPLDRGRGLDNLAQHLFATTPDAIATSATPTRDCLAEARAEWERLRARMISEQEELDWDVYRRYGLLYEVEAAEVLSSGSAEPLNLGERAFEIVLARKVAAGRPNPVVCPARFHPDHRAARALVRALSQDCRGADRADREAPRPRADRAAGVQATLGDRSVGEAAGAGPAELATGPRLEARHLWFAVDDNGDDQPDPHTVRTLADGSAATRTSRTSPRCGPVTRWDAPTRTSAEVVSALVDAEHVPFLASYRYKPTGLAKRAEWECTWALQRREDAIAARLGHDEVTHPEVRRAIKDEIGEVPVPPKYGPPDFARGSYWSQRGKLDVPKERFVSYPGASRDGDGSLLLGWAGWDLPPSAGAGARRPDHPAPRRRQLATERVTPLLAGLAEVLPWVRQWHGGIDPRYGASPADIYSGFLDAQLAELQLTAEQLSNWPPSGRVDVAPLPRSAARGGSAVTPTPAHVVQRQPPTLASSTPC